MGHFVKNCPSAVLSEYSIWLLNGTVVPLYDTLGPEAIAYARGSGSHALARW